MRKKVLKMKVFRSILFLFCLLACTQTEAQLIKVKSPTRAAGQQDVIRMACAPVPVVRIALIGIGRRGIEAVMRLIHVPGAQLVAFCDMSEERTKFANEIIVS